MPSLTNLLESIASSVASQVGGAIGSVLTFILNGVQNDVIAPATSGIDKVLGAIEGSVTSLESAASKGIQTTLTAAASGIDTFISSAESGFVSVLGGVEGGIQTLAASISGVFQQVVAGVEQGFSAITGAVGQAIATVGHDIGQGIADFTKGVEDVFAPILTQIAGFIQQLPADIETIAQDIGSTLGTIGNDIATLAKVAEQEIKKFNPKEIVSFLEGVVLSEFGTAFDPIIPQLVDLLQKGTGVELTGEFGIAMGRITALAGAEFAIGTAEEFFPGAAFIMARLLNHVADSIAVGDFRALTQAGNLGSPNQILDVGNAVNARYRGIISADVFYDQLQRQGYNKEASDTLYQGALNILGVNELISLYKRGALKDKDTFYSKALQVRVNKEQADSLLSLYDQLLGMSEMIQFNRRGILPAGWTTPFDDALKGGFTPERIDALKKISIQLPSVFEYQDFVARKVDDQQQVDKFNLDYGINDEYFELAKAQGFDEKTARRIYRSYWNLPPFFLLASEYKAGKIDDVTFREALAFQRYTPYWIDKFADQLKPTLTQGEIKDMYKYEVIDADHIVPMLESIGMTKVLASQLSELWQASVKLASPLDQTKSQTDAHALKGETKGLVMTAYKDSILTSTAALTELVALGDTHEAAQLRLAIADHELQQLTIKDVYATDKENYLAGNITIEQVLTDLAQAGATLSQQNKYHTALQYAGRSKPRMPTESELAKWYKAGYLSLTQLADAIALLGFADTWIPFFLLGAGASQEDIAAIGLA